MLRQKENALRRKLQWSEERARQRKQRRQTSRQPLMRKRKPGKQKTYLTLMELAQAFPHIAQQLCFHPKQSTYKSLVSRVPRSKVKVAQWL